MAMRIPRELSQKCPVHASLPISGGLCAATYLMPSCRGHMPAACMVVESKMSMRTPRPLRSSASARCMRAETRSLRPSAQPAAAFPPSWPTRSVACASLWLPLPYACATSPCAAAAAAGSSDSLLVRRRSTNTCGHMPPGAERLLISHCDRRPTDRGQRAFMQSRWLAWSCALHEGYSTKNKVEETEAARGSEYSRAWQRTSSAPFSVVSSSACCGAAPPLPGMPPAPCAFPPFACFGTARRGQSLPRVCRGHCLRMMPLSAGLCQQCGPLWGLQEQHRNWKETAIGAHGQAEHHAQKERRRRDRNRAKQRRAWPARGRGGRQPSSPQRG